MSARPMHQPPNPQDMRRLPPTSPSCARVRAKLRDYADGDLTMVDVASVDEHLQSCRDCAVELARSEHEVLRLRRAFEEVRIEQEADPMHSLRSDFAVRVVEQLVLTDAVEAPSGRSGSRNSGSKNSGSKNSGSKHSGGTEGASGEEAVVAAGEAKSRKAGGSPSRRDRGLCFTSPAGMLIAGVAALFALSIGARLMDWSVAEPGPVGRLVVRSAADCYHSSRHLLGGGDEVGEQEGLYLARGGAATVEWHDLSEFVQPAATIEVHGGELQFKDGAPLLLRGSKVLVETNRGVMIPMADGSRLALGIGDYLIAAIPADMVDDLNRDPDDLKVWGNPSDVRIEIEVLSGQPAKILRSGSSEGSVEAGSTASYYGGGQIDRSSNYGIAGRSQDERTRAPKPPALPESLLSGHVLGPNGQPSVGAGVGITYIADEREYSGFQGTGANGAFSLETREPCDREFGVAFSIPSVQRPDLGLVAPDAVPLTIHGGLAQLERPLKIGFAEVVRGTVTDELGAPQFGVHVIPLIIDELFGSVYALDFKKVISRQNGYFELGQLPADLPHHQRLAMLLVHELLEPVVVPVPVRGSELASLEDTNYVMPRLHAVGFHSLPTNSWVTILEEIPGLPVGSAVVRRVVRVNTHGYVTGVRVGGGRMWMHSAGPVPRLKEMLKQPLGVWLHPAATWINYEERLRPMDNLAGTHLQLENSTRHQWLQVDEIPNIVQSQTLRVVAPSGANVPGVQVFAVAKTALAGNPRARFLGFSGANGVHSLGAVKATEDVVVIGPNGGLSWVARPSTVATLAEPLVLQLRESGSVVLATNLRPAETDPKRFVKVTFHRAANEMPAGLQPVAVRFVTDGHWEMHDVPAGRYMVEVLGEQYPVVVPSSGFVSLDGQ